MTRGRCGVLNKVIFDSKAEAEEFIRDNRARFTKTTPRVGRRCGDCFGWHIVSSTRGRQWRKR